MAINLQKPIGILGGTFDPIHLGHVHLAKEACRELALQEVRFIPAYQPVHRAAPIAGPQDRLNMLKIALAGASNLSIDDREIRRQGSSYMIDTLISLRQEFPHVPLCLMLSMDAFMDFEQWHRWQEIINYAHIIVGKRFGYNEISSPSLQGWLRDKLIQEPTLLHQTLAGHVVMLDFATLPISSTQIRNMITNNEDPSALLNADVWKYIKYHKLYNYRK